MPAGRRDRFRHDGLLQVGGCVVGMITALYAFGCAVPPPHQVATPTITQNGGTFATFADVTLGTPTEGATIRYTTDGTDPDSASPIYGATIHLTATTMLRAQASKDGLIPSEVAAATFLVNATTRVSVSSGAVQANGTSVYPNISADGRYVGFLSAATNLVAGDSNGKSDVFVHDRQTGQTARVSVSSAATQGNNDTVGLSLSSDGRCVAFSSAAYNLVSSDTNGKYDIFVHENQTGQTTRVSVSSGAVEANGDSFAPSISADGRYVAFRSEATNLVTGDTNGKTDIFVHDRQMGQTTRVSVSSAATEADDDSYNASISSNGRLVAFRSAATNLVPDDTNNLFDIFVHDRQTGQTTRVSVSSAAAEANGSSFSPVMSADGRFAAFRSQASNLVAGDTNGKTDIFVHDLQTGQTTRVSVSSAAAEANGESLLPKLSANGRYVTFVSFATNLVTGDTNGKEDIFVHDRQTGRTTRSSVSSVGVQADGSSLGSDISADGRYVAFVSSATNLVANDTNGKQDIFVRDRGP